MTRQHAACTSINQMRRNDYTHLEMQELAGEREELRKAEEKVLSMPNPNGGKFA